MEGRPINETPPEQQPLEVASDPTTQPVAPVPAKPESSAPAVASDEAENIHLGYN